MLMTDYLVLINLSSSLQTSSVISFVISLYLIPQICKDSLSKILPAASKQIISINILTTNEPVAAGVAVALERIVRYINPALAAGVLVQGGGERRQQEHKQW